MSLEKAENMLMKLGVDISPEAWPFHCGEGMASDGEAQGREDKLCFPCTASLTGAT